MNRTKLSKLLTVSAFTATLTLAARSAHAVPVTGVYTEDPLRCDPVPNQTLSHELGDVNFFPINEALQINVSAATFTICVPDDNIANDWNIDILNVSGQAWTNLFFVADDGMVFGNADGWMTDAVLAPNVMTDAMRIDGTVTVTGMNDNLLNESQLNDEILMPGESWRFHVSNFSVANAAAPPFMPIIQTPGVFAGSDPIVIPPVNTASILAVPYIPEPSVLSILGFAGAALLLRRPRRA